MLAHPAPHVPWTCPPHPGIQGSALQDIRPISGGKTDARGRLPAASSLPRAGLKPWPQLQGTQGLTREARRAGRATKCHPGGGSGEGKACPMQVSLPRAWPWPTPGTSHRSGGQGATQLAQGGRRPGSSEVMGENRRWKNWGGNPRGTACSWLPGRPNAGGVPHRPQRDHEGPTHPGLPAAHRRCSTQG